MSAPREHHAEAPPRHWDSALAPLLGAPAEGLWRRHCDALNTELFARWLPAGRCERLLKTDLFDEAMGSGLYPLLAARADTVVGVDVAPSVLAAARVRHRDLNAIAADVRALPFADASFDVVVSNSTLDHFAERGDIAVALRGLLRVLRPGGRLLLTLDNLANPTVAVRNALPFALLRRLRLVDYPIGATLGPRRLRRVLDDVGFAIVDATTLLHCPRALAVARARRLQVNASDETHARFLRGLAGWERLGRWPTRVLSGHYLAFCARKR
jgi:SAM-dependent methyltransferase